MMHIKQATIADVEHIARIENACFSHPWSTDSIAGCLENDHSYFYIAFIDGIAAGYMGLQIFSGEGYVTNVAVLPEYRRQGIARALLTESMKKSMEFISLEVRESNTPAIKLYTAFGFENMGLRPDFYRDPDENAIIMTRKFNV